MAFLEDLRAGLREKDERSLEPYGFLQEAGEDIPEQLDTAAKRTERLLLICLAAGLVLFVLSAAFGRGPSDLSAMLRRPAPDEDAKQADVVLQLTYGEKSVEQDVILEIPPREWTRREANALFDRCENELREQLGCAGERPGILHGSLDLPRVSKDGLVALTWSSSDPGRLSEEGAVNLIGAKPGDAVTLTAVLSAGEYNRQVDLELELSADPKADWESSLRQEAESLLQQLPASLTADEQTLPARSPYGAQAQWHLNKAALPWEIVGFSLFLGAAVLFSRTDALKRRLKRQKTAFEQEIPNMTMQMILLLDAGLTVESAFARLIDENREQNSPLYRAFACLDTESRATNMPFVNLLYVYARQSGIRDLIRFASLALDCSGRGSELAEKLDRERRQLWNDRLNLAKAKAREAETKLSLPLMLLLLVMVVIAISPALMEM
jgi:hypothetical protein